MNAIRKPQSESAGEKRTAETRTGIAEVVLCAAVILAAAVLLTGSAAAAPSYEVTTVGMEHVVIIPGDPTYYVAQGTPCIKVPFNISLSGTESARGFFIQESGSSSVLKGKVNDVALSSSVWGGEAKNIGGSDAKFSTASSTGEQFSGGPTAAFAANLSTSSLQPGTYTLTFSIKTAWSLKNDISAAEVSDWKESQTAASFTFTVKEPLNITYHGNGATSGSMSPQPVSFGETVTLKKNDYSRSGYYFTHWTDDSGQSYGDCARVTVYDDMNLYAQWTKKKSGDGGTSIWLRNSSLTITDISWQYEGVDFLYLSAGQLKIVRAVKPEYADRLERNLSLAKEAGIKVTNSKGAPSLARTEIYNQSLDLVRFCKVYEVTASKQSDAVTQITLTVPIEKVIESGLTIDDVTIYRYQYDYRLWTPLDTQQITTAGANYYYTVETDINEGSTQFGVLIKRFEADAPDIPVTPASPAPFAGLLAGLGAAGAVLIFRRK